MSSASGSTTSTRCAPAASSVRSARRTPLARPGPARRDEGRGRCRQRARPTRGAVRRECRRAAHPWSRGRPGSTPAIASSRSAASAGVLAIGPGWSRERASGHALAPLMRPYVGFRPTTPQNAARDADRAAGVASERQRDLSRGENCRRASARASCHAVERPRVVCGAEQVVHRRDAPRELVRLRLADEDRSRVARPADGFGVAFRDVRVEHGRAVRGADAGRVEQVLDAERDALERTGAPIRPRGLGGSGLLSRSFEAEGREAADRSVDRIDAGGHGVEHLDRRQAPRRELLQELLDAELGQPAHGRRHAVDLGRPARALLISAGQRPVQPLAERPSMCKCLRVLDIHADWTTREEACR